MNLSDEKVSQAIAAVMGYKPLIQKWDDGTIEVYIIDGESMGYPKSKKFSAFTPDGIRQWKSYMEREMREEWNGFLYEIRELQFMNMETANITAVLNAQLNPHNLVSYLFDNLDRWGYDICHNCGGSYQGGPALMSCDRCFEGKVLTEKARKFKAIVEGGGK
jgi:hypothetical protein